MIGRGTFKKECDICKKVFTERAKFREHVTGVHKRGSRFSCHMCYRKFSNFKGLVQHHFKHTGARPYKCDECDSTFDIKATLNRHKRLVHNHNSRTMERPLACDKCDCTFAIKPNLNQHKRVMH